MELIAEIPLPISDTAPGIISVDPDGMYYVIFRRTSNAEDKLLVKVYDNDGNFSTEFTVDTTGLNLSGDLSSILEISINYANEKYFKLTSEPPPGISGKTYTIKYGSDDTREKFWEFGWSDAGNLRDRLAFTKENYICTPILDFFGEGSRSLGVYSDEEVLHEIHLAEPNDIKIHFLGLAFSKTKKIMYALTVKTGEYDIMTFKYYW